MLPISGAGMSFHWMCFLIEKATTMEVAAEIIPDRAFASPYDGIKCGKNIITKMPYPNPVTRWIVHPAQETIKHRMELISDGINNCSVFVKKSINYYSIFSSKRQCFLLKLSLFCVKVIWIILFRFFNIFLKKIDESALL